MCVYTRACVQAMHNFSKIWETYKPTSEEPSARGFHAMWLSGFNLFIHGGQGPEGVGAASVRSDTWVYDVFNKVWTQLGSSDASPAGEKMSVNLLYASTAMAFGGINKDSRPVANSVLFDPKSGWSNIEPAGSRPPRSAGHSAIFDSELNQIIVSFGLEPGPALLDDQWTLDLASSTWKCSVGSSPACQASIAAAKAEEIVSANTVGKRPDKRAFSAVHRAGVYMFNFGGIVEQTANGECSPFAGTNELWVMNLASQNWYLVQQASPGPRYCSLSLFSCFTVVTRMQTLTFAIIPFCRARAFSGMDSLKDVEGYQNAMVLFGGADMSNPGEPQPMNDGIVFVLAGKH